MKTLPTNNHNQGIFSPKLGHFFPIFEKGQGRPPPLHKNYFCHHKKIKDLGNKADFKISLRNALTIPVYFALNKQEHIKSDFHKYIRQEYLPSTATSVSDINAKLVNLTTNKLTEAREELCKVIHLNNQT